MCIQNLYTIKGVLCVSQLWERFRPGKDPPKQLGPSRDFNIDMVPKFIMANGNLVKVVKWTSTRGEISFQ